MNELAIKLAFPVVKLLLPCNSQMYEKVTLVSKFRTDLLKCQGANNHCILSENHRLPSNFPKAKCFIVSNWEVWEKH